MISVKVSYTVKSEFVNQNRQNIESFLADFKKMIHAKFLYNVYLKEDGLTFVHISMYENETIQNQILNIPSFLSFQQERNESGLINQLKIEKLDLIGSSLSLVTDILSA